MLTWPCRFTSPDTLIRTYSESASLRLPESDDRQLTRKTATAAIADILRRLIICTGSLLEECRQDLSPAGSTGHRRHPPILPDGNSLRPALLRCLPVHFHLYTIEAAVSDHGTMELPEPTGRMS